MKILSDLEELVEQGIIDDAIAARIQEYYRLKKSQSPNRLVIAFGIMGSLLVGLGIILIIAHNWDELPLPVKTLMAFLPLLIGQALCGYTLIKKTSSTAWRETSGILLALSIGTSIALISQIYNINSGNLARFLMVWALLGLPIIYLMKSSATSLLYLICITSYAMNLGFGYPQQSAYAYWLLLIPALPYYYSLLKNRPKSNALSFHHWLVPLSICIALATTIRQNEEMYLLGYVALFSIFSLFGEYPRIKMHPTFGNGYKVIGSLGNLCILLALSFTDFWRELPSIDHSFNTAEAWINLFLILIAASLLIQARSKSLHLESPFPWLFIPVTLIYILGVYTASTGAILINLLLLGVGISNIQQGAKNTNLKTLNYGMMIIAILISCRFFDTDISFVLRGTLFMAVGISFFIANYWMIKKKKNEE